MRTLPQLTLCEAIKSTFKNYFNCSGRARRSEFCKSFFFLYYVFGLFLGGFVVTLQNDIGIAVYIVTPILGIFALLSFLPFISLFIRRLHDIGKSGCYFFIYFVPMVGMFILFYYLCIDSEENANEYGPSPKYVSGDYYQGGNNFNQPINPTINPYPQQNYTAIPVNSYSQFPMVQPDPNYPQTPVVQPVYDYPLPIQIPPPTYVKTSDTPNTPEISFPGAAPLPQGNPNP